MSERVEDEASAGGADETVPAYELARRIADAILDAGIAGRDPVTRAELEAVIESALSGLLVLR